MYKYILTFMLYFFIVIYYLLSQYNTKLSVYAHNLETSVQRSFSGAVNSLQLLNDSYHDQYETKLAFIVKDANGASVDVRDKIRYKLRKEFTSIYNDRKLASLDTFHIFDKYGNSLLRFHHLDKYDDPIIQKRKSLKIIKDTMLASSGFEIGLYATSYRFQYPLFYDGEFVGSYEFGIKFEAIDKEMQKLFGIKNVLFIYKKYIDEISSDQKTKDNYVEIKLGNHEFYTLKTKMNADLSQRFKKVIHRKDFVKKISYDKASFIKFSHKDKDYMAINTPIDDINGEHIGFLLTVVEDNISSKIFRTFIEEAIFAALFGLTIVFFIYKEVEYKRYVRNIIDTQKDMLIVTDGKIIKDANQAFLDFFDVKSIYDFYELGNRCVCDYFLKEDGYLQKTIDGINWIEYIHRYPDKDHIVVLKDKDSNKRYIKIIINGFSKSNDFIVVFYDITDELQKQKELEGKAYYDSLTNIYSRDRFDHYLNKKLHQKREFSLIMFDIDHFKYVNDNYGHDVGDNILIELTKLVTKYIREEDIFARWGGEEFMIIVNSDIVNAERFANKLRKIIDEHKFNDVEALTCSFGVVSYRGVDKFDTIVKRVDNMLYSAKNSGRNCVVAVN